MSTPYPPAPPQPGQVAPGPPKKTSPWLWILGGCAVLIVLGVLAVVATGLFVAKKAKDAGLDADLLKKNPAVAVTKMMAALNPDLEVLEVDEGRGIVRVRDKKTGKSVTLSFEDVKKGRILMKGEDGEELAVEGGEGPGGLLSMKTKDGSYTVGGKWNPPDWVPAYPGAAVQAAAGGQDSTGASGMGFFSTSDSLEQVLDYYENELKSNGMEVTRSGAGALTAQDAAGKRSLSVQYAASPGGNKVSITYSSKK